MARVIELDNELEARTLFGARDCFLRKIRDALGVQVAARGTRLWLEGEDEAVARAAGVFKELRDIVRRTGTLRFDQVDGLLGPPERSDAAETPRKAKIDGFRVGRATKARTPGQARYMEAMREHELVFAIGPAGTGKTYLAVAMALQFLKSGAVRRIVLARPAVEAGESLGFLPGDVREKVNPYLRPLYDALHDLLDRRTISHYIESGIIEILPLAFMRGRTLDDAFVILDEAQNCTVAQMKTFLTRLGVSSRVVVTGDITQIDLHSDEVSGLVDAQHRLKSVTGVAYVYLGVEDIVRHRLVREIVNAYGQAAPAPEDRTGAEAQERDDSEAENEPEAERAEQ